MDSTVVMNVRSPSSLTLFTHIDINECLLTPRPCSAGQCQNTEGSFRCVCPSGYQTNSQQTQCIGQTCFFYLLNKKCHLSSVVLGSSNICVMEYLHSYNNCNSSTVIVVYNTYICVIKIDIPQMVYLILKATCIFLRGKNKSYLVLKRIFFSNSTV